jgi:hypothetical protein
MIGIIIIICFFLCSEIHLHVNIREKIFLENVKALDAMKAIDFICHKRSL